MADDPPKQLYFFALFLSKQGWQCHHFASLESTQASGTLLPSSLRQYCQIGDVFCRETLKGGEDEDASDVVAAVSLIRSESSIWLGLDNKSGNHGSLAEQNCWTRPACLWHSYVSTSIVVGIEIL